MARKRKKKTKPQPSAPLITESKREQYFFLPLTLLLAAAGYFVTLCPTVYVGDSGELATAAYYLGIPHSPGYPLYCLIGYIFTHLPYAADIGFKMNVMSATFAWATVLMLYLIVYHFTRTPYVGFSVSLAYAFSPIFWSQAVVAEVYSLNTFLTALALYFMCRWVEKRQDYWLYLASFIMGLAVTNHQLSFLLLPTGLYMLWLFGKPKKLFEPFIIAIVVAGVAGLILYFVRHAVSWPLMLIIASMVFFISSTKKPLKFWLITAGLYILGLSVYLYLPIRAAADPVLNWGNPETFGAFFETVLKPAGSQTDRGDRLGHFIHVLYLWTIQFGPSIKWGGMTYPIPIIWAFGIWGIYKGLSTGWRMARVFILFMLINAGTIIFLSRPTQQELIIVGVYYLPAFLVFAVFMATGLREWLIYFLKAFGEKKRTVLLLLVILILVMIPIYQFRQNLPDTDRSGDYYARDYGTALLTSLPPDSILIVNWDDIFTLWYLQMVEKVRPDVIPVLADLPIGTSGNYWGNWYFKDLEEEHPAIFDGYQLEDNMYLTREEAIEAFVTANLNRGREVYFSFYGLGYDFALFDFKVYPKGPVYVARNEEYNLVDLVESQQAWERLIGNFRNLYTYRDHMISEEDFIIARLSSNLYNTAKVALELDEGKGIWFLEQAVMVDNGNLPASMELAILRFQNGQYTEARDLLLDSRDIDPSNPDVHLMLARLYQVLGQNELALKSIENLLMIDPNHPDARAIVEQLTGGE